MENLYLSQETDIFTCPYNKAHRMPRKTWVMHYKKCPDQKLSDFKICTFNHFHVMPSKELEDHESNCPDRVRIDSKIYQSEDISRPKVMIDNAPNVKLNEDHYDDWGDLPPVTKTLKNINQRTKIMQTDYGLTKSQRKMSRYEQNAINVDKNLSFDKNSTIHNRHFSGSEASDQYQTHGNQLFIGRRPNIKK